jgi:hypothetical protein
MSESPPRSVRARRNPSFRAPASPSKPGSLPVRDQLSCGADRLIESTIAANFDTARKKLVGKQPDLATLLDDRLAGGVRLRREFRLLYLPVQALEALAARISTC